MFKILYNVRHFALACVMSGATNLPLDILDDGSNAELVVGGPSETCPMGPLPQAVATVEPPVTAPRSTPLHQDSPVSLREFLRPHQLSDLDSLEFFGDPWSDWENQRFLAVVDRMGLCWDDYISHESGQLNNPFRNFQTGEIRLFKIRRDPGKVGIVLINNRHKEHHRSSFSAFRLSSYGVAKIAAEMPKDHIFCVWAARVNAAQTARKNRCNSSSASGSMPEVSSASRPTPEVPIADKSIL